MTTARGAMTIGPVGIDIPLTVPSGGRWNGDTLTVSGTVGDQASSATVARVARDQFHGLSSRVGDVLACTFGDTPELDGFYRLGRPTLSTAGASFESGVFDWSAELERVRSSAQALQELRMVGAGRSNSHSFTTVRRGWWSPGVNAFGIDDGAYSVNAPTRRRRSGSDGAMLVIVDNASGVLFLGADSVARWMVAPGDFYKGACSITRSAGGSYYRVVGNQIPASATTTWAIGNTLVSVLGSTTANVAEFTMLWHDGTAFESAKKFRITTDSSWTEFAYGPTGVSIIRNDSDAVGVRIFYGAINTANQFWLDVGLRRGARHAEFRWHAQDTTAGSAAWGVKLTVAEACTGHTSGTHATSADASGNKVILTTPSAVTVDNTNGRIRSTGNTVDFPFMIGAEMAGAGASFDDFTSIVYQYMGALNTRQRTVIT